jgi:hypothetical protein
VREARRVTDDDANARSPVAARAEFFHPALVKHRRRRSAIFDEYFSELTTPGHRLRKSVLEDFLANQSVRHGGQRIARLISPDETANFLCRFDTQS